MLSDEEIKKFPGQEESWSSLDKDSESGAEASKRSIGWAVQKKVEADEACLVGFADTSEGRLRKVDEDIAAI